MSFRIEKELTLHPLGKLGLPGNSLDKLQLLCDARTMRELDRNAIENIGIPGMVLMENAARSFTDLLEQEILEKIPIRWLSSAVVRATTAATDLPSPDILPIETIV